MHLVFDALSAGRAEAPGHDGAAVLATLRQCMRLIGYFRRPAFDHAVPPQFRVMATPAIISQPRFPSSELRYGPATPCESASGSAAEQFDFQIGLHGDGSDPDIEQRALKVASRDRRAL